MNSDPRRRNHLLAELPESEFARIAPALEHLHVRSGDVLARPGLVFDHAYFPLSGMASIVALLSEGLGVEVATIGNEGMVGLPIFLGSVTTPFNIMWQLAGEALRIRAVDLLDALQPGSRLSAVLNTYSQAFFVQTAQGAACNGLHSIHQRSARWLLATQDRAGRSDFLLTHEFLAFMLGVRRQSVSLSVADLANAGLIRYHRGHVVILDRERLEAEACECYEIIRGEFERLLGVGRA